MNLNLDDVQWISKFKQTKVGKFIIRWNLIYLVIPFLFWGLKAGLYNLAILINSKTFYFTYPIDQRIPFCKYFIVFYVTYYFLPQILLWFVSFSDKKKYWHAFLSIITCTFISFIVYCCFNVQMIREPGYPTGIRFGEISSVSTFFDYWINWLYKIDPTAMNCFPSMHAVVGTAIVILGTYIPKYDKMKIPAWFRAFTIISGTGCVLSTLFIKQHYLIDVIIGVLIEILAYVAICVGHAYLEKRKRSKDSIVQEMDATPEEIDS